MDIRYRISPCVLLLSSHTGPRVFEWCIHLIHRGNLMACILENVRGITHKLNGESFSFASVLLTFAREIAPSFEWDIITLNARNS